MSTKTISAMVFSASALSLSVGLAAQDVATPQPPVHRLELKFNNEHDRVTLKAQNITIREILTEWGRQCGCQVIGADKITNSTLTIPVQYENQPKELVIRSLLSPGTTSGGYVLTEDRLVIAPLSHPTAVTSYASSSSPVVAPLVTNESDELPPVQPIPIQQNQQSGGADANKPAAAPAPVGVMPVSGVPTVGPGRSSGPAPGTPGTPTVPPPGGGRGGF